MAYYNFSRGELNHSNMQHVQNIWCSLDVWLLRYACGHTDRRADRHPYCKYFAAGRGAKYMYVDEHICAYDCLSTHISQKPHGRTSPNFMCLWQVDVARLSLLRYVMYNSSDVRLTYCDDDNAMSVQARHRETVQAKLQEMFDEIVDTLNNTFKTFRDDGREVCSLFTSIALLPVLTRSVTS